MLDKYNEMRYSGYKWIGNIPKHWKIVRMKNIFENVSEKGHPDAMVLSLYREYGILPKDSRDDNHNVTSLDTGSYKFVRNGDLVINKMKAWQGSLAVSKYEGIVSPAYYVCKFRRNDTVKEYYHYLLRARNYAQEFERLSTGMRVGQWDLNINDFMRVPALLPTIEEQSSIARYLDEQCDAIDGLIEETEKNIEEYSRWENAIISETVLNGLDTHVTFEKSGVSWVAKKPRGWQTARLKNVFSFGKGLPITKADLVNNGIPVISYGQIHAKFNPGTRIVDDLIRYVPEKYLNSNPESRAYRGDILIADTSEDIQGCGNSVYVDSDMKLFGGYHTIILHSKNGEDNKYLAYLFKTDAWRSQIRSKVSGVKLFSITKKILNDVTVLLPLAKEQKEITDMLDKRCEEIDSIINAKEKLIAELENYKKSLIFDVVTGKRKVV